MVLRVVHSVPSQQRPEPPFPHLAHRVAHPLPLGAYLFVASVAALADERIAAGSRHVVRVDEPPVVAELESVPAEVTAEILPRLSATPAGSQMLLGGHLRLTAGEALAHTPPSD